MNLLTVIPITKNSFKENLSYFTSKNIKEGSLVTIPIRKREVPALVVSVENIKSAKTKLKSNEYSLRAIKNVEKENFLDSEFIQTCKEISNYYVTSLGAVIKNLVPQIVLESRDIKTQARAINVRTNKPITLCQFPKLERVQYYKSIIREEFAKKQSVIFCLPTIIQAEEFSSLLKKGIEKHTIVIHSKLTKKKQKELWQEAVSREHPVLIITTKSFLSIPRDDIGTLILENENSPFYKFINQPFIDARKIAEIWTAKKGIRLILGDDIVRTETYHRFKNTPVARMIPSTRHILVDMNENLKDIDEKTLRDNKKKKRDDSSYFFSEELKDLLTQDKKTILFINKRGYSPTTVCNNCYRTIICEKCESPLVIHKEGPRSKKGKFICHKCLKKTEIPLRCPYCKSWEIEDWGMGIQKAEREITQIFPTLKIFRMDSDTVKTPKQGRDLVEEFMNHARGVLIGTELMFSYLHKPVEQVAVLSIDSLFAFPDFRINEKIFQLLLKLKSLTQESFLIQTRIPDQEIFNKVKRGNISGFYKQELEIRQMLKYPPFATIIKLTKEGKNKETVEEEAERIEKLFSKWDPISYSAFIPKVKGTFAHHILIKISPEKWQSGKEKELYGALSSLPSSWKINVDPESLL